jgi:TRAP-type mannitol/chloroaromatic compound transport system permease small subunit
MTEKYKHIGLMISWIIVCLVAGIVLGIWSGRLHLLPSNPIVARSFMAFGALTLLVGPVQLFKRYKV